MSLIKCGQGITDIRGGMGGVYFHRDKSGLHSSTKPRTVYRRSAAQNIQRNAFIKTRTFCKNERFADKPKDWLNRCVSYNIYRALNDLDVGFFAIVTNGMIPDGSGTYKLAGTYNGKDYYRRGDGAWFLWWDGHTIWYITVMLGESVGYFWYRVDPSIEGIYINEPDTHGNPTVALSNTEPPVDYQIPKL